MNDEFFEKEGPSYQGMRKEQVQKLVRNTKQKQICGDAIGKIEVEYSGDKRDAFLCHSSIFSDKKGPQRMMAFSVPELMSYLNYAMVSSKYVSTVVCLCFWSFNILCVTKKNRSRFLWTLPLHVFPSPFISVSFLWCLIKRYQSTFLSCGY